MCKLCKYLSQVEGGPHFTAFFERYVKEYLNCVLYVLTRSWPLRFPGSSSEQCNFTTDVLYDSVQYIVEQPYRCTYKIPLKYQFIKKADISFVKVIS